jgi:hypothetical protein
MIMGLAHGTIGLVRRLSALLVMMVLLLTLIQVAEAQAEPMPNGVPGTWGLRVNEEFTGAGVNTALWTPGWQSDASITGPVSGGCEASKNVYQPGNGYIYLQLRAEHATCGTATVEDTGAVIESNPGDGQPGHSGFAYTYGVVEWEASLPGIAPTGRGCPKGGCLPDWPALWSLSNTNADEIDTMEGLETLGQVCYHIHPPTKGPGACLTGSYAGWHKYASEWEPGVVKFFVDGAQVGELSSGELNSTPQYLIADMVYPGCCNQPVQVPDEMTVNYVRVWQHPPPPVPPTVTTTAATSVKEEQATLNGSVNPNGLSTSYFFEYGLTTSYGSSTPIEPAGAGTVALNEKAVSTGLRQGATYHFRIVATNGAGTVHGEDKSFTTPASVVMANYVSNHVVTSCVESPSGGATSCSDSGFWLPEASPGLSTVAMANGNLMLNYVSNHVVTSCVEGPSGGATSCSDSGFWQPAASPSLSTVAMANGDLMVNYVSSTNVVVSCVESPSGGATSCSDSGFWLPEASPSLSTVAMANGNLMLNYVSNHVVVSCVEGPSGGATSCSDSGFWLPEASPSLSTVAMANGNLMLNYVSNHALTSCVESPTGGATSCSDSGFWIPELAPSLSTSLL